MDIRLFQNLQGSAPTLLTLGICWPFVFSGASKLCRPSRAVAEVSELGLPFPVAMAWLTIAVQLGGSGAAILGHGSIAALGALALAGFTLLATWMAHAFWKAPAGLRAQQANLFMEHLSIVSALVFVAWWKWTSQGIL
ncbi:DoxX family protein [Rhodoferax sp.]|uniref:DoxX family protein n=1 Tax=Rhodoferax sp. TaxID=50421 RepID=UPI00374CF2BA